MPRHGALALCHDMPDKVPLPNACLDTMTWPSACLDMVPRSCAMTCLDKVPSPNACLDTVTWPSACLYTVPRPSTILRHDALGYCHDMDRQGASV